MENDIEHLQLLFFFDRACPKKIKNSNGDIITTYRKEWVKCRLWFKDSNDLKDFLKIHRPIMWGPELFDSREEFSKANSEKPIETKWVPFCTMTAKELGIKD